MVVTRTNSSQDINLHKDEVSPLSNSLGLDNTAIEPDQPVVPVSQGLNVSSGPDEHVPVTVQNIEWIKQIQEICSAQIESDDPCMEFLRIKGFDLRGVGGIRLFVKQPSPLNGRRWYVSVTIRGKSGEFLVDTGASHSMIGRDFFRSLAVNSDVPVGTGRVSAADGSEIRTYGRQVLQITIGEVKFVIGPTVAELTDDGILGLDFFSLYGGVLDTGSGSLLIRHPYPSEVKCVLRRISGIATVQQTVKIPPQHVCNVLIGSRDIPSGRMGVVEPDAGLLNGLGLASTCTLVKNSRWAVVPVSNPTPHAVYLDKDTVFGNVTLADVNGRADSPEVERALRSAASAGCLEVSASAIIGQEEEGRPELDGRWGLPLHLLPLMNDCHLATDEDRETLAELLRRKHEVFCAPGAQLGRTDRVCHKIDTGSALPVRLPYRRLPVSKKGALEEEVDKMLEDGIIVPSESPWSSPVVMVTKKDGSCRFCIDYRRLNGITRKNAYPLPRIDESLDSLGGNQWFCTLDLQSGYWQIGMDPDDREKTAFTTHLGLFEWNVMPFGLCNAPATFENMMETMLRGLLFKKCLVYLDDVIVFGDSKESCLANLEQVLDRLISYNLKLKPKKCKLFRRTVEYLGRIISPDGIKADPTKIESVATWPTPRDVKEVRSFLGFCSYYRDFIPGFAKVATPIQRLVVGKKKGVRLPAFIWPEEADSAFARLKELFTSTPVLSYPNETDAFILDTDASNDSIGAVLSQVRDGREVPIAFASNSLSKTQRNYCTTKRELLAVVVYTKKYRHYLYGGNFVIRTDHSSLRWLLNFKEADGMMGRWMAHLSELGLTNVQIEHRSGAKHINADCLSRRPIRRCPREDCDDCGRHNSILAAIRNHDPKWHEEKVVFWSGDSIREAQGEDPCMNRVRGWISERCPRPVRPALSLESMEVRQLVAQWSELEVRDGLLCRWKTLVGRNRRRLQIVLPSELRLEIFEYFHGHRTAAHFGRKRTMDKVAQRYYWPGMSKDIIRWLTRCPTCCLTKTGSGVGKSKLCQELFGVRFARIALDIISGFVTTSDQNTCMMVVQDYYTKFVQVIPLKNHKARTCAESLVKGWVLTFGAPLMLHSDQGREFESHLWSEMCDVLAICKTRTNPYRPQSDGQVERFNRTLISGLKTLVNSHQDNWDDFATYVAHAYNSTVHASTGCTPNMLVFGSEIIMPADLVFGTVLKGVEAPCTIAFAEQLRQELKESYILVRESLEKAAHHQKRGYDTGIKARRYTPGQKVVRLFAPAKNKKLLSDWDGPFEVAHVLSEMTVILRSIQGKLYKSHVDRLRPWLGWNPKLEDEPLDEVHGDDKVQGLKKNPDVSKKGPKRQQKRRGRPRKTKKEIVEPTRKSPAKSKKTGGNKNPPGIYSLPTTAKATTVLATPVRRSRRIADKTGVT